LNLLLEETINHGEVIKLRSKRLSVLLVQLPHPCSVRVDTNVPLAAGYLKAAAYQSHLLSDVDIEILGADLEDSAGCQMLIDTIISKHPDIVGFLYTCGC